MTLKDLAAIRARRAKATPGPWTLHHRCVGSGTGDDECCGLGWDWDDGLLRALEPQLRGAFGRWADADFVMHVHEDIDTLLAEVERLQRENERLKARNILVKAECAEAQAENARLRAAVQFALDEDNVWAAVKTELRAALSGGAHE